MRRHLGEHPVGPGGDLIEIEAPRGIERDLDARYEPICIVQRKCQRIAPCIDEQERRLICSHGGNRAALRRQLATDKDIACRQMGRVPEDGLDPRSCGILDDGRAAVGGRFIVNRQ